VAETSDEGLDCLHRPSMWSILRQYGILDTIVTIIQNLYKGSRSCVKLKGVSLNGMSGDWFEVVTGVRQGCMSSPLLFAIVIDWVMKKSDKFPRLCSVLHPLQHSIGYTGDGFYRLKDPTNSIKVVKEMLRKRKNTTKTTKYTYAETIMTHKTIYT